MTADDLRLRLSGYTHPGQQLFRNVLFDQLYEFLPKDPKAKVQLANTAKMPFVFKHLAAMPDVHVGIGATVGSVVATKGAIIPAAVGVDIGCGMIATQTTLTAADLPEPVGKFHRGHNPHASMPYLCIGVCVTPPDKDHVTNVDAPPWAGN